MPCDLLTHVGGIALGSALAWAAMELLRDRAMRHRLAETERRVRRLEEIVAGALAK